MKATKNPGKQTLAGVLALFTLAQLSTAQSHPQSARGCCLAQKQRKLYG